MENLDATILATATTSIGRGFGVPAAQVSIAITAYLVAVAAFIPLGSWLAERWGSRPVFLGAVALFTLASVACALSPDLRTLTLARLVQGFAGSMMVPIGRLVVLAETGKADLVRAIAYLTWPALVAPVVAPLVGGLLTEYAGWPWIFLVNVPVGVLLLVVAWRVVPHVATRRRPLDVPGLLGSAVAIAALVLGFEAVTDPATAGRGSALLVLAAVSGLASWWWLRRAEHPLLDLTTLRIPTFRVSNGSGSVYRAAVSAAPFLVPLLLQDGFGWSPVDAGLMLMWVFVGNLGIKPFTTPLLRRFPVVPIALVAAVVLAATFVASAALQPGTPRALVALVLLVSGVARSVGFTAYNTLQFADVPPPRMGPANALAAVSAQLATGLGVAVAALAVRSAQALTPGAAAPHGYRVALLVMAVAALASTVGGLRLPRGAGHVLRR
ncbi:multidrug efflux MFS transporter [Kineosporiaceae bacterium B12]|nr:multidrug efflux MFS transporter [Kineococcus rubinsiae]